MQAQSSLRTAGPSSIEDIHALAEAELRSPSPGFDAVHYIDALREMRVGKRSIMELEAKIMLQLAGRIRASRTRIFMNTLRAQRTEEGNRSAFDEFEAMLFECFGTNTLFGHSFLPNAFKYADHAEIWDLVRDAVSSLEDVSTNVFLNAGTLLGVVRDGKLIDHDDDVDLAVMMDARTEREAGRIWRRICDDLEAKGMLNEEKSRQEMVQVQLKTKGDMTVDLFPAWVYRGKVFVYPHTYGELDESDVLPLRICDLTGLKIPAEPEKMLVVNYGEHWRQPDPYFVFHWKKSKIKFARLLRASGVKVP